MKLTNQNIDYQNFICSDFDKNRRNISILMQFDKNKRNISFLIHFDKNRRNISILMHFDKHSYQNVFENMLFHEDNNV